MPPARLEGETIGAFLDDVTAREPHREAVAHAPRDRVVARMTHAELLAMDGLYARLYREQFLADDPAVWAEAPLDPDEGDRDDDEPAPIALAGV